MDFWWAVMVRRYLESRRNCYASYLEQILLWNYLQSIIHFCRKHIDIEYFNCIVTSDWLTIENHKGRDTSWQTFNLMKSHKNPKWPLTDLTLRKLGQLCGDRYQSYYCGSPQFLIWLYLLAIFVADWAFSTVWFTDWLTKPLIVKVDQVQFCVYWSY